MRGSLIALVQLLARAALVDTHHGDADGPSGFPDAEAQIAVVGVDVAALLSRAHDLHDGLQDAFFQRARFEAREQRAQVRERGCHGGGGGAALDR